MNNEDEKKWLCHDIKYDKVYRKNINKIYKIRLVSNSGQVEILLKAHEYFKREALEWPLLYSMTEEEITSIIWACELGQLLFHGRLNIYYIFKII